VCRRFRERFGGNIRVTIQRDKKSA
jgi:hypothetical protein